MISSFILSIVRISSLALAIGTGATLIPFAIVDIAGTYLSKSLEGWNSATSTKRLANAQAEDNSKKDPCVETHNQKHEKESHQYDNTLHHSDQDSCK